MQITLDTIIVPKSPCLLDKLPNETNAGRSGLINYVIPESIYKQMRERLGLRNARHWMSLLARYHGPRMRDGDTRQVAWRDSFHCEIAAEGKNSQSPRDLIHKNMHNVCRQELTQT